MTDRTWRIESTDGTSIAVHRQGSGDDVVLVHGTACDHRVFARLARRLVERGFACQMVDRRGRGASGDAGAYAFEREAEDVAAVLERIADDSGTAPHLVGHSLGGIVALEAAARSVHVERLAVYEPPILGSKRPPLERADELERLLEVEGEGAVVEAFLREVGYGDAELAALKANEAVWEAACRTAPTIPREVRADLAYEIDPFALARIEVPTFLMVGSESPPMFRDAIARLKANLPDARTQVLEGASHAVLFQAPDVLAEALADSLGSTGR